jgi:O-antigen/teichoic acid export membrane protein
MAWPGRAAFTRLSPRGRRPGGAREGARWKVTPKKQFVRDTAGFALSQYLSRFVQLFRSLIAARLLGPAAYGSWNALLLVLDYGILTQLGLQQGLDQRVPGSLATDPPEQTNRLKRGGVAGMTVLWILFAAGTAIYLVVRPRRLAESWGAWGVMLMVVAVLLQMLIYYHGTLLRSHGRIGVVSKTMTIQAIVGGLSGLGLVFPFGVWGLLAGWLAGQVIALAYIRRLGAPFAPLALVPNDQTRELLAVGFPIFLFTASNTVLRSIDRVMILKFLSVEALGYYSIGLMGISMLLYLPDSIAYVLYPRMIAKYAETGDADATAREMVRPLAVVAWVMPLVVGIAVFWVRELVTVFLPQFQPGVRALSVLLFGALGLALASIPAFYIMAIRRQVQLVPLAVLTIAVEIGLMLLFIHAGAKIEGVALAVSLGSGIYGLGMLGYSAMHAASTTSARIGFVMKSALPSILTVLLCTGLYLGLRPHLESHLSEGVISLLLCSVFLAFYLLLARRLKPRTGVVSMLRESSWPFARMIAGVWARD